MNERPSINPAIDSSALPEATSPRILDIVPHVYLRTLYAPISVMKRRLTSQQQAVYDFIKDKIVGRGYGPTVREIGEHMNIKSPNGVMCHLRALERKGMIQRAANKSRAIELTESITRLIGGDLAIRGGVTQQGCRLLNASGEHYDLRRLAADGERFLLRVDDDSLQELHILAGDLLLMEPLGEGGDTFLSGKIVLLRSGTSELLARVVEGSEARHSYRPLNPQLTLPAQSALEQIGVLVGVLRLFEGTAPTSS